MNRFIPIMVLTIATLACSVSSRSTQAPLADPPQPQPSVALTSAPTAMPVSSPTSTIAPAPAAPATAVSTSTPTSRPPTATSTRVTAVKPVLRLPEEGRTYQDPVVFRWDGKLGPGQVYVVRGTNPDKEASLQSPSLSVPTWTTNIPFDKFGEWIWTVSVQQGSSVIVTSAEGRFWFNQFPDRRRP
jgi:hypothetical protein